MVQYEKIVVDSAEIEVDGKKYSMDDKLQWEVAKLRVEVENLSKPFRRQPASWLALMALFVSVLGNAFQYSAAERLRQLAEVRKERLDLEATQIEAKKKKLEEDLSRVTSVLQSKELELRRNLESLTKIHDDIKRFGETRDRLAIVKEAEINRSKILDEVVKSLSELPRARISSGGRP